MATTTGTLRRLLLGTSKRAFPTVAAAAAAAPRNCCADQLWSCGGGPLPQIRVLGSIPNNNSGSGRVVSLQHTTTRTTTTTTGLLQHHQPTTITSSSLSTTTTIGTTRSFASSNKKNPKSHLYHIEASNVAQEDCTQLVVTGPDMDGVLASMTIALSLEGCSVVDLHANTKSGFSERLVAPREDGDDDNDDPEEDGSHHDDDDDDDDDMVIHDVFCVVDRSTGRPFEDTELERLARALLRALQEPPLRTLGGTMAATDSKDDMMPPPPPPPMDPMDQITIVPSATAGQK